MCVLPLLVGPRSMVCVWTLSVGMETAQPVLFTAQLSAMLHGLETPMACAHGAQLLCAWVPSCPPPFGLVPVSELCVSGEKKQERDIPEQTDVGLVLGLSQLCGFVSVSIYRGTAKLCHIL